MAIRDHFLVDLPFIINTFLKGLYFGNPVFRQMHQDNFLKKYGTVITHLLQKPTVKIRVACDKEQPGVILGFAIYEDSIIHWVFVRQAWRRLGIARDLVPAILTHCTHVTTCGTALKYKKKVQFDPFLI